MTSRLVAYFVASVRAKAKAPPCGYCQITKLVVTTAFSGQWTSTQPLEKPSPMVPPVIAQQTHNSGMCMQNQMIPAN